MALTHLEHFLIYANDIEETKSFYTKVLGLTVGTRPNFKFPGYWLYLNSIPVVHLVSSDLSIKAAEYLDAITQTTVNGSGAVDHIAFNAENFEEMQKHLDKLGIVTRLRIVSEENGAKQIFIRDPNGIGIELNFRSG